MQAAFIFFCLFAAALASTPPSPLPDASDLSAAGNADASLASALQQSDECVAGSSEQECALNALQLRGVSSATGSQSNGGGIAADDAADGDGAEEGDSTTNALEDIRGFLQEHAPGCVEACVALPEAALALFAAQEQGLDKFHGSLCADTERLAGVSSSLRCAAESTNAELCGPALRRLLEQWPEAPTTPAALAAVCEAAAPPTNSSSLVSTKDSAAAAALLARAGAEDFGDANALGQQLDDSVQTKTGNPICKQASEGQTCIPNPNGGHSNQYIYCSAHREISPNPTNCEARMGKMSWCVGGGTGLTHNYCDDPFCRNGGAYAGNGLYCHNGAVVRCNGLNAPVTVDACSSQTSNDGCCTVTTYYKCVGTHPQPYCAYDHVSRDCSSCHHGHGHGYYR